MEKKAVKPNSLDNLEKKAFQILHVLQALESENLSDYQKTKLAYTVDLLDTIAEVRKDQFMETMEKMKRAV